MLTRRAALVLSLSTLAAPAAFAQGKGKRADDPTAIVRAYYAAPADKPLATEAGFSRRLAALYRAAVQKGGELGEAVAGLDFEFLVNGQDEEPGARKSATYAVLANQGGKAKVRVNFRNFAPQELTYDLVRENGSWRIDEVSAAGKDGWRLSELYAMGAKGQ